MLKQYQAQLKRMLSIMLMGTLLLGFQLVQADELHDHSQHNDECFLYHIQLGNDAEANQPQLLLNLVECDRIIIAASQSTPAIAFSLFQGRAPPVFPA